MWRGTSRVTVSSRGMVGSFRGRSLLDAVPERMQLYLILGFDFSQPANSALDINWIVAASKEGAEEQLAMRNKTQGNARLFPTRVVVDIPRYWPEYGADGQAVAIHAVEPL